MPEGDVSLCLSTTSKVFTGRTIAYTTALASITADTGINTTGSSTETPWLTPGAGQLFFTANDGATDVELGCATTTAARVRAQAVGNIFFDIGNEFVVREQFVGIGFDIGVDERF